MSVVVYRDAIGDLYLIPKEWEDLVERFDSLISDTISQMGLHEHLVEAWVSALEPLRYKEGD